MKHALIEATADTAIATAINMPLNFLVLSFTMYLQLNALQTTLVITAFFTVLAIVRKTAVRLHFHKRQTKG